MRGEPSFAPTGMNERANPAHPAHRSSVLRGTFCTRVTRRGTDCAVKQAHTQSHAAATAGERHAHLHGDAGYVAQCLHPLQQRRVHQEGVVHAVVALKQSLGRHAGAPDAAACSLLHRVGHHARHLQQHSGSTAGAARKVECGTRCQQERDVGCMPAVELCRCRPGASRMRLSCPLGACAQLSQLLQSTSLIPTSTRLPFRAGTEHGKRSPNPRKTTLTPFDPAAAAPPTNLQQPVRGLHRGRHR